MSLNFHQIILVAAITCAGALIRFWDLTNNPPSLNIDEVAYTYDAYSILKTGYDQYGNFLPLTFQSIGDYKNPIYIYSLVPTIHFLGLNEISARFNTALIGTLFIPFLFYFILQVTKDRLVALLGAILICISPWQIYYSRFGLDYLPATFIMSVGMWILYRLLTQPTLPSALFSGIFLTLSMYTYHTPKLFMPLFLSVSGFLNFREIKKHRRLFTLFILLIILALTPLLYSTLHDKGGTRAGMVFLSQDIDFTRYVILDHLRPGFNEHLGLFFFWVKRYLNYLQPDFLFFTGLNMTLPGIFGLGVMYIFELPFITLGLFYLIHKRPSYSWFILSWIILGLIPASLTNNEQSAGRALIILPAVIFISALGAKQLIIKVLTLSRYLKYSILALFVLAILSSLIHTYLVFTVHFPNQQSDAFMEGSKESILFVLENQHQFDTVIYDPYRGLEAQNVVNVPHLYYLFYSSYPPDKFQDQIRNFTSDHAQIDNFIVRRINWRYTADRDLTNTLFIGSPWSLPEKDIKPEQILKRFYLKNGRLVLLAVRSER